MKEASENHLHQIQKRDSTSGGDHAEFEALRGANRAGLVSEEHDEKGAESETHGLNRDARVGALEHGRDTAQRQTFEERVNGGGERSPVWFEDGDQCDDEAPENAANHPRNGSTGFRGMR